ncbi:tryptophan-rich sensory protein [Kurthia populi]|uniref:Tryptophan-rich sensory protein n=1 Tax=Kurthia populi TaxID=1562132 RepID=A0ABW5Y296_9BACL
MGRFLIVLLAFIALFIASLSAYALPLNNHTALELAYSYKILMFPALYVYWLFPGALILLAYWVFAQWQKRHTASALTLTQAILFAISSIVFIVWINLWHYEQFILALAALAVISICLFILYLTYPLTENKMNGRLPISIAFAAIAFLTFLTIGFLFISNNLIDFGLSRQLWAVVLLTCAAALALAIRFHLYDAAFPAVFIWFLIGVAIANTFNELLVTTAALFLSGVLIVGIIFIRKRLPSNANKKRL